MGTLARFDLAALVARHGLVHFVETGTGQGQSLAHASRFGFRTLRSCEIESALADAARRAFTGDDRVAVVHGRSDLFLATACAVTPVDEPILFWLDAHFPGADYGLKGYGDETDDATRLPLPRELRLIAEGRPAGRDVILVDDLRVWIDGAFGSGNLPDAVRPFCPKFRDAEFLRDAFAETHGTVFDWTHEGYAVIAPKPETPAPALDDDPAARVEAEHA